MSRPGTLRPFLRIALRFTPRAIAGVLALFSLLISHQVIWTAFADVTRQLVAPRLWLITNLETPDLLGRRTFQPPSSVTSEENFNVELIASPDAPMRLLHNGRFVNGRESAAGRFQATLRLRRGINYIAASTDGPDPEDQQEPLLREVIYSPPANSVPLIVAWRRDPGADRLVQVIGFADPDSVVFVTSDPQGQPQPATTDSVGLFSALLALPSSGSSPLFVEAWSRMPPVARTGTAEGGGASINPSGEEQGFQFLSPERRLRRRLSFRVNREGLAIDASAELPIPTYTEDAALSRAMTGGEFLRDVFGVCVTSLQRDTVQEQLGSLRCNEPPTTQAPFDVSPYSDGPQTLVLHTLIPLEFATLTVNHFPQTALARTFLGMPEESLTIDADGAGAADLLVRANDIDALSGKWQADSPRDTFELFKGRPVLTVERANRATVAPVANVRDEESSSDSQPTRAQLIDRIRALEELVPVKARDVFATLLSALPFLYLLWILHAHATGKRAHLATVWAVTLTFLMLHMSILAVTLLEVSFTRRPLELVNELVAGTAWSRSIQILRSATYIYPFLAIGIALLVRPVFRALRRARLAGALRRAVFGRALGWLLFWIAVVAIPVATVWALARVDLTTADTMQRAGPLGVALLSAFAALWFVLFWFFRGILRVGVGVRHSMQASWAMLLLPVIPLTADSINAVMRGLIATQAHMYPWMLPERVSPYLAGAIVTLLGAILLRQTGELSVRLTQHVTLYRWWRAHRPVILLAALVIAIPVGGELRDTDVFGFTGFLGLMDRLLPYAVLIGAALVLHLDNPEDRFEISRAALHVGALCFAWYVTRGDASVLFVPVPFLMAWFLFRRWLIVPVTAGVPITRDLLAAFLDERRTRLRLENLQKGLDKKFSEGELKLADYKARLEEGQAELDASAAALTAATGGAEARVFAMGPETGPWANARMAVSYGLIISAPFQLLTLVRMLSSGWGANRFPLLEFSFALLYSVITWAVMAAVFGYFYHRIRGRNGFEKALSFSLCVVIPAIPLRLIFQSLGDRGQLLDIVQVVAFTLVLALLAFDLRTLQKHRFGWRELMSVYGLASAAYGSTILIAVASTLGGKDLIGTLWSFVTSLAQ